MQEKHAETLLQIDVGEEDSGEVFPIILAKGRQETLYALRIQPTSKTNKLKLIPVILQDSLLESAT